MNERKEIFEEKKLELATIVSETEKDEEKLLEQSKKAEKVVDERLLSAYKRIRKSSRNGLAVVSVEGIHAVVVTVKSHHKDNLT